MEGLKQRIKQTMIDDPIIKDKFGTRVYYFGEVITDTIGISRTVTEINRQQTPEVYDDNTKLVVLTSAFIVIETNNDNAFSSDSRIDFFSIYIVNASESIARRIRQVVTQLTGGGICEVKFVNGLPDRYDDDLKASLTLIRFMCTYFERIEV